MKLLYDENLSRRFVRLLADPYPDSQHVVAAGLARADDTELWEYAAAHDLVIVSKDWDFLQLSTVRGILPRWFGCGLGIARWRRWPRCCGSGTSICSGSGMIRTPRCS